MLIAAALAAGMNTALAGSVLPSDTELVPPKNNGQIIAPIAGFNWHTRSDNPIEVPIYKNVDRDSDDYWNYIVDELLLARVHAVLWHGRHCDSLTSGTRGRGDMCPRHLTKYVDAAKRAGAENILKAGYFDDTGNYPNAAGVSRLDLSNRNNWVYFWDHRMKIWFDTVPKNMWYLLDGKPVVVFWNLSSSNFSNQQGNASKLLAWLKNNFKARYGMEPVFILQDDWFTKDTTINSTHAYGKHSWFSPKTDIASSIYSYTSYNGAKWGAVAPAFSKQDPAREVSRRDGATLDMALAKGLDAKFTFLESWTNWAEGAGFYRSNSWSFPNQYISIVRKYADPKPETIRFQAEGADRFSDTTSNNEGGEYIDRALDVGRLADGSGWYVGWIKAGEWLEYRDVQLGDGTFRFTARVATNAPGKRLHLEVGGVTLPSVELPNTGGLGNYQLVHLGEVPLKAGMHKVRLAFDTSDGLNVDWFFLKRGAASNNDGVPAGYTWCANEGGSCTLSGLNDVAYGAQGKFYYKYGVTGTIAINNNTFGDPIPGVAKAGYYKPSSATPVVDPNAYYFIRAKHSGKALDVSGVSSDNGANIHQWALHGGDNQQWKFESAGDGYYFVKAKHSGKVVDVSGPSTDDGANVHQWSFHGGTNQQWKLQDAGDGHYYFVAKHSGKALDVSSQPNTGDGANVHQWSIHGGDNQKWKLEKAN